MTAPLLAVIVECQGKSGKTEVCLINFVSLLQYTITDVNPGPRGLIVSILVGWLCHSLTLPMRFRVRWIFDGLF